VAVVGCGVQVQTVQQTVQLVAQEELQVEEQQEQMLLVLVVEVEQLQQLLVEV